MIPSLLDYSIRPVTITGNHLVEEREDSPLTGEEQDDTYENPGKAPSKDPPRNPPDFADEGSRIPLR